MMTITPNPNAPQHKGRAPIWQRLVSGALLGGVIGIGGAQLALWLTPDGVELPEPTLAQAAAIMAGAVCAIVGIIVLAMSFSKRLYEAENWTEESDADEHGRLAPTLRLNALTMLAMGAEFVALGLPPSPVIAVPVIAVVAITLAVQFWASWRLWLAADELQRAAIFEGSTLSLCAVLLLLSLWAPLAMYGFVGFDPLAVIMLTTLVILVPTIWVTVKRGLTA